jgi:hypothetical protein
MMHIREGTVDPIQDAEGNLVDPNGQKQLSLDHSSPTQSPLFPYWRPRVSISPTLS